MLSLIQQNVGANVTLFQLNPSLSRSLDRSLALSLSVCHAERVIWKRIVFNIRCIYCCLLQWCCNWYFWRCMLYPCSSVRGKRLFPFSFFLCRFQCILLITCSTAHSVFSATFAGVYLYASAIGLLFPLIICTFLSTRYSFLAENWTSSVALSRTHIHNTLHTSELFGRFDWKSFHIIRMRSNGSCSLFNLTE